ncbi:MAG: beta-N-acetylhexosaminidase [Bacteroidales bacterium]
MKNLILSALSIIMLLSCTTEKKPAVINIIPRPQEILSVGNQYEVKNQLEVSAHATELDETARYLGTLVADWNKLISTSSNKKIPIIIEITKHANSSPEAYSVKVEKKQITISGNSSAGCFHGIQTLKQLLKESDGKLYLNESEIHDFPNFAWRSYLLDEARHFFGKEFVKKQIDELAAMKMNKFHWHLTDDAGWRIEIKKYPKLTAIGGFRNDTEIETWGSGKLAGKPHGGFYTQEEIKEVIAYAKARHIQVVPEIEMPGHASAAIAAYPWLGIIGELTEVPYHFGKLEDSYNIANPKVVQFLKDVLDEVCELFPSDVIHIGGDEVLFGTWSKSKEMQAYMKKNKLNSPADAQIKFTNDISNYLEKKGKRMMGWNEIMGQNVHGFENTEDYKNVETALSKKTIVHFWRGEVALITEAAQNGYQIVNSLHTHTYLDYKYKTSPLKKIYSFNPIPKGLDAKYEKNIIGVGAQMWNEWNATYQEVEYKTFPRIVAIAEVAWSGAGEYQDFVNRLKIYSENWTKTGVNFPTEEIK